MLVVSADEDALTVIAAIEAGANGYLRKSDNLDALSTALHEAVAGEQPISPELAFILSRDPRADRPQLTDRERQVLDYAGSGLTWERGGCPGSESRTTPSRSTSAASEPSTR